jgi:hypothetical protein
MFFPEPILNHWEKWKEIQYTFWYV